MSWSPDLVFDRPGRGPQARELGILQRFRVGRRLPTFGFRSGVSTRLQRSIYQVNVVSSVCNAKRERVCAKLNKITTIVWAKHGLLHAFTCISCEVYGLCLKPPALRFVRFVSFVTRSPIQISRVTLMMAAHVVEALVSCSRVYVTCSKIKL